MTNPSDLQAGAQVVDAERCERCDRAECRASLALCDVIGGHDSPTCRGCRERRDCVNHAVTRATWRTEALASRTAITTLTLRAEAAECEVARLTALRDEDESEAEQLRSAIEDHLPMYALSDEDDDTANHVERIEYAGDEIEKLTADVARWQAARAILDGVAKAYGAMTPGPWRKHAYAADICMPDDAPADLGDFVATCNMSHDRLTGGTDQQHDDAHGIVASVNALADLLRPGEGGG